MNRRDFGNSVNQNCNHIIRDLTFIKTILIFVIQMDCKCHTEEAQTGAHTGPFFAKLKGGKERVMVFMGKFLPWRVQSEVLDRGGVTVSPPPVSM